MTFEEVLDQALAMLQRRGRVTYRTLQRQFQLDNDALTDLTDALLYTHPEVHDDAGRGLVWTGDPGAASTSAPPASQPIQPRAHQTELPQQEHALPAVSRPPDAERRQLTVMFCDLVDSTILAGQLDPEDLREVVRAYQQTAAEVIQHFDGHIAQYLGDGLLVYFGYPQAHEDDAQRAVRAGLGLLAALEMLNTRLEREQGVRLAIRVGIHTGRVVVGEVGGGERQEHLALGETPNVAARLQGLAGPHTVLISADTYRLVQGYIVVETLGPQLLKGVVAALPVYRVLGEKAFQSRLEMARATGLTPLVGRRSEMTLLLERWTQSSEGQGQVVLLSGEAGIGKSRLVDGLYEHIQGTGVTRLVFRCSPYHTSSALSPVIEHVQRLLHFERDDTPAQQLDKLERVLQPYDFPLPGVLPLLAALLAVPLLERYPPLTLTPERQRQRTLEALVAWLLAEAERQPVLAVWEDLHWVDPSTLDLLSLVIDQAPTARMLTLLTCRPEFRPPWTMRSHLTQLTLSRLSRPQVEDMTARLTGGKALPAEVLVQVVARTDGVPLFVEELVKMLLESGLMEEEAERYGLTGSLPALAIPTTLQDSLMARLDRLGPARDLAQLGAVLGREFSYEMLQAVAPLDEATLQRQLARLVDAELVYQRGLPPQSRYLFKHALIQEAAYESLLRRTRQQYHQQIAQVFEAHFPELSATQPELLAHHYTAAGLSAQAPAYWQRAGERALGRSAYREATVCFEQALSALQQLPENRDTREQAIDLRLALRSALHPLGDFGRILASLREAEALAAALDDPRRLGRVSRFLSFHFHQRGAYDQAIAAAQRALALATASGDVVLHALTNQSLGNAYQAQGDYRRAITCFEQTMAFLDGARRHERFGHVIPPAVRSCAILATCHAELGTFAEGRALGDEGLRIAEAVAHPVSLMVASWGVGLLALRQGDLCRALPLLERAVGICQDADLPVYFPWMAAPLGAVYTLAGRVADAVPLLTQAMEQTATPEMLVFQALCSLSLGEAQMLAGHLEEAHALTERALAFTREHQERGNQAYAMRLLGEVAARREPPEAAPAEDHYRQALVLAEELGMRPLVAHCHFGLGSLYANRGQQEQAHTELAAAIALYRAMEMTFWLPQVEAVLAQVVGGGLG